MPQGGIRRCMVYGCVSWALPSRPCYDDRFCDVWRLGSVNDTMHHWQTLSMQGHHADAGLHGESPEPIALVSKGLDVDSKVSVHGFDAMQGVCLQP